MRYSEKLKHAQHWQHMRKLGQNSSFLLQMSTWQCVCCHQGCWPVATNEAWKWSTINVGKLSLTFAFCLGTGQFLGPRWQGKAHVKITEHWFMLEAKLLNSSHPKTLAHTDNHTAASCSTFLDPSTVNQTKIQREWEWLLISSSRLWP